MTIKHIRWVACIGLLAIICLQYVWLVNTYKLTKESIQFRSNEVFRDLIQLMDSALDSRGPDEKAFAAWDDSDAGTVPAQKQEEKEDD